MTSDAVVRYARTEDGVEIAYAVVGSGPPVVLAGGALNAGIDFTLGSAPYMSQFGPITENRALVLFDWRGLGASGEGVGPWTEQTFLLDLDAVVAQVGPHVDLIGDASPCHIAIHYAATHPDDVRRLALNRPSPPGASMRNSPRWARVRALATEDWRFYSEVVALTQWGWIDVELARLVYERMIARLDAEQFDALMSAIEGFDAYGRGPELTMPTIAIVPPHRPSDRAAAIRRFIASIPDCRTVLQGTSPGDVVDRPLDDLELKPVRQTIAQFLAETDRPERPGSGGLTTILFTDIVSSTPLLTQLRDERMREAMRDHDAVCEAAIAEHGGRVVKTIGDAFMAEFTVPSAAVEAAIEIQHGIRERFGDLEFPLRLRIGINAGEPIVENGDLHGASVVIAKRLESAADAGGILVSDVVRQAVAGKDFTFDDRGDVELKGFDQPIRAWAVRWE